MTASINVKIIGKVQGVFFRVYAREKALKLGLSGWIKNQPDGSVILFASGEKEKLKIFLAYLKKGTPMSRVEKIKTDWRKEASLLKLNNFEILK